MSKRRWCKRCPELSAAVAPWRPPTPKQARSWVRDRRSGGTSLHRRCLGEDRSESAAAHTGRCDRSSNLSGVLTIDRAIRDAIVEHARRDHPDEACGVVAGPFGSDRPERFVPMLNAAMSTTFYEFDSTDLLRLYREMDDNDEEPVIIYHSHTATEAYPSRTDISLAQEPGAHYVLVSTRDGADQSGDVDFRSFRIVDGQVTEEEVRVVERYDFVSTPKSPRKAD